MRKLALSLVGVLGACPGCWLAPSPIVSLERDGALEVVVDANTRRHDPRRLTKFFVDIVNRSGDTVDLDGLTIELQASPRAEGGRVTLREEWSYNWDQDVLLKPGGKISLPIVPERGLEFPLELLSPGEYEIVAVVNERYRAAPYLLRVERPDLSNTFRYMRRDSLAPYIVPRDS